MSNLAVFHIEGGIGKHIASTAVVGCYKHHHPDTNIIISCVWPEVYINNPHIHRVYKIGNNPYFYEDNIYNRDVEIFAQEPYKTNSHIMRKSHLVKSWCDMIGVTYDNEQPVIVSNFREREIASRIIQNPTTKPVLIFQPFGGPGKENQETPYSWTRDIHPQIAQQLVDILNVDYFVVHVCYDFHPRLDNCLRIDQFLAKKVLFNLLHHSHKRLLIDSCLQHAAAALNLSSTVVWVATRPEIFGYELHTNIIPKKEYLKGTIDSYLYDYNFTGLIHECPYENPHDIFNVEKILNSLK